MPATLGTLAAQLRTVGIGLGVGGAAFYTLAAFLNLLKWGIVIGAVLALAYYMYRHWSSLFPTKPVTATPASTTAPPATAAGTPAKPSLLSTLISPFKPVLGGPMTHQG